MFEPVRSSCEPCVFSATWHSEDPLLHVAAVLLDHTLEYCAQVPGSKPGEDSVDVVLVDEEAVGTADTPGCGAKVLRGSSGLENLSCPAGSTMTMEHYDDCQLYKFEKKEATKEDLDLESEAPARALSLHSSSKD
ncbi:hypothetical protein K7X08_009187 [Anisodus acutangulus]|uniref:Uncharacterized protein n=1 Tax=Anisodus acutangulus TaxID=402998 RepID=A0A9Q1RTV8_9SOLA|nr:hypothetical protein K7X08_009187 [Anisodus acutangulus]